MRNWYQFSKTFSILIFIYYYDDKHSIIFPLSEANRIFFFLSNSVVSFNIEVQFGTGLKGKNWSILYFYSKFLFCPFYMDVLLMRLSILLSKLFIWIWYVFSGGCRNFEVEYECHQNYSKAHYMKLLEILETHPMWLQNWPHWLGPLH